ncbi:T9SS type A sorting domain-containing protein [candidate division KSB1 bacterium]|nr:T9SS type A sorting domain-containing protein [candidate division KSB1 bacterium]
MVSVDSDDIQANRPATGFALYPNPFNGSITIAYNLQTTTQLVIHIFNLNGEKVRTIFNGLQSEGNHVLMWDGKSVNNIQVASGIYFCRLTTNNYTQAIRITYIK